MGLSNSQYNDIIRDYDERRRNNEQTHLERIEYVNSHIEGFKKLSDTISSLSVESTMKALSGDKSALSELHSRIEVLSRKKAALLASAGLPSDYLDRIYDCPDCQDTGYINGSKCHCFKLQQISVLYEQSNISDNLKDVSFSMLKEDYYKGKDLERFRDSLDNSVKFVQNFDSVYQNLLFYGTVGVGKSLLSSCIAKELIDSGHSVIYFSASSLMDTISRETFGNKDRSNVAGSDIYECDLLIIDDLGTEMTNNFTISSLFTLLNERMLRKKSIVISTNLLLEELRDRYSDRIFSRITGGFTFCRLSGPDIRFAHKYDI